MKFDTQITQRSAKNTVPERRGAVLGASWGRFGRHGAVLGRLGAFLGRLGAFWGPSWGRLGASWGVLGPSWSRLGAVLSRLGGVLGCLEGGLGCRLRPSWGRSYWGVITGHKSKKD